jgi:hypothetical protein
VIIVGIILAFAVLHCRRKKSTSKSKILPILLLEVPLIMLILCPASEITPFYESRAPVAPALYATDSGPVPFPPEYDPRWASGETLTSSSRMEIISRAKAQRGSVTGSSSSRDLAPKR